MESSCALLGTSVVIRCQYDYPFPNIVTSVAWSKYDLGKRSWIPLESLAAPPNYLYVGNRRGDCSLRINRIRHVDSGYYRFSFVTTLDRWKSSQFAHVTVKGDKITLTHIYMQYLHPRIYIQYICVHTLPWPLLDLLKLCLFSSPESELSSVVQPSTVTEGDNVQLTCASGCPTLPDTVWFKDEQRLRDPGRVFQAGRGDAGRYHCGLKELETVRSASAMLTVQCK